MNTCPKCGAEFPATTRICPNDGTVLEAKAAADPRIGTTLDGKYRLDSALGQGGMGTIYRATHLMLDKPVALKLIKADLVTSSDVVRRFQREARAASNLNHPNIAAAYDLGQTADGTLYIAMELVRGQSLKDVIRTTGPLDAARIGRILRQVASALAAAHQHNIIHRDLKPHNIMLTTEHGVEVAKLLDFGIAKTFDESATQLTATGFVLGTPQYMAPEQAAGRPIDGRSDLYSLGIIMFEMLVGDVPFNDPSTPALLVKHLTEPAPAPSRRRPDLGISPALEAVALRCMEKDPAARYQTAEEFSAALESAVGQAAAAPAAGALAPTIVMPAPGAPTATTPAAAPLAPTVMSPPPSGHRTGQIRPPTLPSAPAPAPTIAAAAVAGTAPAPVMPPPPASSVAPPPPASAPAPFGGAVSSTPQPSGGLGRNAVIVGAVLLLMLAVAAYGALTGGWFSRSEQTAPVASVAETQPPPAPPAPPPSTPQSSAPPPSSPPADPPSPSGTKSSPLPGGASGSGSASPPRGGATTPGARGRATGAAPPAQTQTAPAAPPAATQPANPIVTFRCAGAAPVCASLRGAMPGAMEGQTITVVNDASKADILIEARVEVVSERTEQLFGQTFVTRTYSVELSGESRRDSRSVPMPPPTTFSFDARVGQEKLDGQTRVIAAAAAEKVRAYWK